MPGKMARSAAHPPFRTVHVAAAVRATRLPCQNAGKAPKFALVRRFIWGIPAYGIQWTYDTYALAHGTGGAIVKQGGTSWFFITADYAFGLKRCHPGILMFRLASDHFG